MQDTDEIVQQREKTREKIAKADEETIKGVIQSLLQQPAGRLFLWQLLSDGAIGANPFSKDPLETAFRCGEMNYAQRWLDRILKADPEGYAKLVQEQADHERNNRDAIDRAGDRPGGDDNPVPRTEVGRDYD